MWNMFHEKSSQYDLRSKNLLILPQTNTVRSGNDYLVFRGSILWNAVQMTLKAKPPSALLREVLNVGVERCKIGEK